MLGLGNSIIKGGVDPLTLWGTITSDFSSGVDSWVAHSVEASSSDLTLSSATGPDGESGWLKGVYGADQTDTRSGVVLVGGWNGNTSGNSLNGAKRVEVSARIYLEDDWGGSGAVATYFHPGSVSVSQSPPSALLFGVAQDTITTISETLDLSDATGSNSSIYITWGGGSGGPQNGAIFWLKDIVLKVYG